jgi:radical SAM/Cys-rich protein
MEMVLAAARKVRPKLVDITGGAPEMNPDLQRFVRALQKDGHHVQVRTNLTILLLPEFEGMMDFYRGSGVKLVASFPCYMKPEVDNVRGEGVFEKSLEALRKLNAIGFGKGKDLVLDLVFNPEADFLPAPQAELEAAYKEELAKDFGITFNNLLTITNMPVGRFKANLEKQKADQKYDRLLRDTFNAETLASLMCLSQVDIGWDGRMYDCDFNYGRGLPVGHGAPSHVRDFDATKLIGRRIVTGDHCFGCTAGHGSSCGGALEK